MTLTVLKNIDQVFWRIDLNSDLPDVFLLVRLELCFVGKKITEAKCHSQHIKTKICTINMTHLLCLFILITWLQAVCVGFLCWQGAGATLAAICRLLVAVASLAVEHRLEVRGLR